MNAVVEEAIQFPLKVVLTAMSERRRALIEYYISHNKDGFYALAESEYAADIVIIDHDHEDTAARLEAGEWRPDAALMILSARPLDIYSATVVAKPLDKAGLAEAAKKALTKLNQVDVDSDTEDYREMTIDAQILPKLTQRPDKFALEQTSTPAYFRTNDAALPGPQTLSTMKKIERYRAKIDLLCGPSRSLEDLRHPDDPEHRVDPAKCLSRTIAAIVYNSDPKIKAARIALPDADIFILPTLNKVYCSLSLEYKTNVQQIFKDWEESDIEVFQYQQAGVNEVIDTLNRTPRFSFSAHSFCWLSALFSLQGRLPQGFDIESACKLRHWPNITRLELTPYCLEIVAAWSDRSANLRQIVELVGCEPRHAVSLFNAALTINVMAVEENHDR